MIDGPQIDSDKATCHGCGAEMRDGRRLCNRCVRITERRLGDIPALVDELELTASRQGRGGGGRGHRKKGDDQPLPFNAAASGKRALVNLIIEWADVVAHGSGVPSQPLRPAVISNALRARGAVAIMLRNIDWFRRDEQAAAAFDAVWSIRDQLRSAIDRRPERLYAGPCRTTLSMTIEERDGQVVILDKPSTCTRALYRKWGEDTITCDGYDPTARVQLPLGCGAIHTVDERRDFLLASAEEHLLPLRLVWESLYELVPAADVPWETARKWPRARRIRTVDAAGRAHITTVPPRLTPRTITVDGVELYRGGDIIDLARDEQPRTGRRRQRTRRRAS